MSITIAEIRAFLESNHPFVLLPPATLQELAQQCKLHAHEAGEVVYSVGDEAECLYLIYSGAVALTGRARGAAGIPRELTRLQGGRASGWRAL